MPTAARHRSDRRDVSASPETFAVAARGREESLGGMNFMNFARLPLPESRVPTSENDG